MKVLYLNALYPTVTDRRSIGGAETFAVRLVRGMLAQGHTVSIVRSGTALTSQVEQTEDGLTVYSLPCFNIYPMADGRKHGPASRMTWHILEDRGRVSKSFEQIVKTVKPDIIHSNNVVGMTTDVWRVARAAGIPILHTLHDYYLVCPKVMRFTAGKSCNQTCRSCSLLSQKRRRAARDIDLVVGVSQRMLDIHRAEGLFVDTPWEVILNAPPPRAGSEPILPRPLGPRPVFGFIGRQAAEKGIYDLLAAFCTLQPGAAKLLIAGTIDPAVGRWVKENAGSRTDIEFTGYITPDAFFPAIDVAVFPSIWEEPCSMGVGEAFSFGVPVLGSTRGGTPELLDQGRLGWTFQPGTGELANSLADLVANPAAIAAKSEIVRDHPATAAIRWSRPISAPIVGSMTVRLGRKRAHEVRRGLARLAFEDRSRNAASG